MNRNSMPLKALPSLLAGTSRSSLPADWPHPQISDSCSELDALSLAGQALRFERPSAPASFAVEPVISDDRKIISDHLRRPLLRVLTSKAGTEHTARALGRAFDRLRLRPHPFDLPSIEPFVRAQSEKLGATAQHWADRQQQDAAPQSYFDPGLVDETNWTHVVISRRLAFLEQQRRENANAARALIESNWAQEEADSRFRILQLLHLGLSTSDQAFLLSLEKDRAPRVRTLAAKLLARLSDDRKNPALVACLERIKASEKGLFRKKTTLQLELPATVKDQSASHWVYQAFAEVSFAELARAFEMAEMDLIEASTKDEPLLLALAVIATNENRLELLEQIVEKLPNAGERLVEAGLHSLGMMNESERQRWQAIVLGPYKMNLPVNYVLWESLCRITNAEAPPAVMSMILRTTFLAKVAANSPDALPWAEMIAAVCPVSQRPELRTQLMTLDPGKTATSLALLEILDGMENDRIHV